MRIAVLSGMTDRGPSGVGETEQLSPLIESFAGSVVPGTTQEFSPSVALPVPEIGVAAGGGEGQERELWKLIVDRERSKVR